MRKDQNPDAGHGSGVALPVGAQKPGSTGEQCCGSESPVCSMHSLPMQLSPTVPAGHAANASIVNPVLYSQLWSLLGRPRGKQAPSTGLLAIALALGACDKVSVYGFSQRGDAARCSHHYWACPAWAKKFEYVDASHRFHDWQAEVDLREKWIARGIVVDGAKAYGSGAEGAAAVRAAHRKLAESAASERERRTARAARLARYADRHVPKPPPWFEVRR